MGIYITFLYMKYNELKTNPAGLGGESKINYLNPLSSFIPA